MDYAIENKEIFGSAPVAANDSDRTAKKRSLRWVFNKAAEMAGRAALTGAFKIAAVSVVTGIGASSFLTFGAAVAASGAGAALFAYGKATWLDYRASKTTGSQFSWWNADRAKKTRTALLCGVAGGAFGAWLAGTDTFQTAVHFAAEHAGRALSWLGGAIVGTAHAATLPAGGTVLAAAGTLAHESTHAAVAHGATQTGALSHLAATLDKYNIAHGTFTQNDARVSGQFLKDRAHEVLRMKSVPQVERFALARELATAAKERGNRQAVTFLRDLARLERIAGLAKHAVPHAPVDHAASVAAADSDLPLTHIKPAPAIRADDIAAPAPSVQDAAPVTATVEAPSTTVRADAIGADGDIVVTGTRPAPTFAEAARCNIVFNANAGQPAQATCTVLKQTMDAGDFVSFVDSAAVTSAVTTKLGEGSVSVPTSGFLNEKVVGEAVDRLTRLRPGFVAPVPGIPTL